MLWAVWHALGLRLRFSRWLRQRIYIRIILQGIACARSGPPIPLPDSERDAVMTMAMIWLLEKGRHLSRMNFASCPPYPRLVLYEPGDAGKQTSVSDDDRPWLAIGDGQQQTMTA
ncbi:hypothetical protein ACLOJK_014197 [Asimina triloba]